MFTTKHTPLQILSIGEKMFTAEGYGSVSKIARSHKISRSCCYNYKDKFSLVLENFSWLSKASGQQMPVITAKSALILQEYLLHRSSVQTIAQAVRLRGMGISKGEITDVIAQYGSCLPVYDVLPDACCVSLSIDETFEGDTPYLAVIDSISGYLLGLKKSDNRKSETWSYYIAAILAGKEVKGLHISADFARQIRSCLSGLELVFHGDLFHYYRVIVKELVRLWNKFKKTFAALENAEKALHQAEKALNEQIIPTAAHKEALKTALQVVSTAQKQAGEAMQHYDNARFLLQQSKKAFAYFDEHGNWISHQQAQQLLQTVCELFREIPDQSLQKAVNFFEKQLPAATPYIAEIEAEVLSLLAPQTDYNPNIVFLWQVVACICKHRHSARCCKQYEQQAYHQQQANQWEAMLSQQLGEKTAQTMLQHLQTILAKANRSSSMIETANSRLKPFLHAARGQISQKRLNLIRFYLNHCPYERSRVDERKGVSPYQLFYQKKDDKRSWYNILCEDFLNKSA